MAKRHTKSRRVTAARRAAVRDSASKPPALFEVEEARLANGLQIRLLPNPNVPTISYYTFFRVGSRNERPGITGISHLFEHMMFNGAKKYGPKEFDRVLESNGGYSNAYTTYDLTVYHEEFAAEALETVIDLESDRMRSLRISDRTLASEREVVKEERRVRVENEIIGLMDEELGTLVYKAHPYRWPVIGWMRDIENIGRADCEEFFRTYYAPNNATVFVAGDFQPKDALRLIRRYYRDIRPGPAPAAVIDSEPEQRGERRATLRQLAQAPSLLVAYRGPPARHADTFALDALQYVLSVGEGSRLVKQLVYGQELAVSVGMDWSWRIDPGAIVFHLELKPESDPHRVEQALYAELSRIAESGPEPRELDKAKNNLQAHLLRELVTNSGRANALGTYEFMLGSWRDGLSLPERYRDISAAEVRSAAARYLDPLRRSVVTLVPEARAG
ncbi:MAG TPA: pitrilysin family protein [Myxococcaceae bacterium]|nr:pitrilysin family protein [Myxococcaceae bacterium]